jgi:type II secretory pathway pseudopilin PulG
MRGESAGGGPESDRRGLGAWNVILGAVVLGLIALAALPRLDLNREKSVIETMRDDARRLLEAAETVRGASSAFPSDFDELATRSGARLSEGVEVCALFAVPGGRPGSERLYLVLGHPGTTRVVGTVYPEWGGRIVESETGVPGCGAYGS